MQASVKQGCKIFKVKAARIFSIWPQNKDEFSQVYWFGYFTMVCTQGNWTFKINIGTPNLNPKFSITSSFVLLICFTYCPHIRAYFN